MSVTIRNMTDDEYEYFYRWSVEHQAADLAEELQIPLEEALRETIDEISGMLPDGPHTAHNHLMSILEPDSDETVGFIWTIHEETAGRKQSFLCDFAIWESKRRKGYAAEALLLAEQDAAAAGCAESVLFAADRNIAAKALYQKCGYQVLRRKDYGCYMIKQLI